MEVKVKEKSAKCWRAAILSMKIGDTAIGYGDSQLKACQSLQQKLKPDISISVKKVLETWKTDKKEFVIKRK